MGNFLSRLFEIVPFGILNRNKQLVDAAVARLGLDTGKYNFAISGHTKTGKSFLVNSIIKSKVAVVDDFEATMEIQKYDVPTLSTVVIWDIPGSGTPKHKAESYFSDKCLYAFDCLIILLQSTLTTEEINLAQLSLKHNQPVIFVRSLCDMALENRNRTNRSRRGTRVSQEDADKYIEEMSIKFEKELKDTKDKNLEKLKVFFISAVKLEDIMENIEPDYHFQEKEFMRELKIASESSRGK